MEGDTTNLEDWEVIEKDCNKEKSAKTTSSMKFPSVLRHFFVPARHSPLEEQEHIFAQVEEGTATIEVEEKTNTTIETTITEVEEKEHTSAEAAEGSAERLYDVPPTSSVIIDIPDDLEASLLETAQIVSSTIPSCTNQNFSAPFVSNIITDIENESDHEDKTKEENSNKDEKNEENLKMRTKEPFRSIRNWFLNLMEYTKRLIFKIVNKISLYFRSSAEKRRNKKL